MTLKRFFQKTPTMSTDQVRAYIDDHACEAFTLLDVRQPDEYRENHIPGALLIPVGEIHQRLAELDSAKPTVVYCRSGARSAAATSILVGSGFKQVWSMTGGMLAWDGLAAAGLPEAGMAVFDAAHELQETIGIAWQMETNAEHYYTALANHFRSAPADHLQQTQLAELFVELAKDETHHAAMLTRAYRQLTQSNHDPTFPLDAEYANILEGCIDRDVALAWAKERSPMDVIEMTMSIEANAHDRYSKLARNIDEPSLRSLFSDLVEAEKDHLKRLTEAFAAQRK